VIRIVLSGLRVYFIQLSRSAFDVTGVTVWPILYATIAYYMFGSDSDPDVLLTAALGATVMAIWSSVTTGASGALEFQRRLGTLELLVAAPAPFIALLAPMTIATAAIGVYALFSTLLWSRILFGIPLQFEHPLLFALALPSTIVAIGMLGLILAAAMVLYRAALFLGNSFEYPGWLVTGLLVPLSVLPGWVEPISWVLAPTWGIRAIRESAVGGAPLADIGMCFALSAVYAGLAAACLRGFEHFARKRATLALA
jgi:ABC-2 type transport system permease protein